jgi:hypothetical protein
LKRATCSNILAAAAGLSWPRAPKLPFLPLRVERQDQRRSVTALPLLAFDRAQDKSTEQGRWGFLRCDITHPCEYQAVRSTVSEFGGNRDSRVVAEEFAAAVADYDPIRWVKHFKLRCWVKVMRAIAERVK